MAHFAELDENNIVQQVIVVNNEVILDENGIEQEATGVKFCQDLFGGRWVQTFMLRIIFVLQRLSVFMDECYASYRC
jgi:hypothetical protein